MLLTDIHSIFKGKNRRHASGCPDLSRFFVTLTIEPHLQVKELQKRYRNSSDPVSRSHHQIIWLLAQGKTVKEVAQVTSYTTDWIYKLARRYNQKGENAEMLNVRVVHQICVG